MATLKIRLGPPLPDPTSFRNHSSSMTNEEKAVLSLRGFACAASMLLPAYHLLIAATEVSDTQPQTTDYPTLILRIFLRESMLNHLLVYLRRLYDPDPESLGGGTIATLLSEPQVLQFLLERAANCTSPSSQFDMAWAESHLSFVQKRCAVQIVRHVHQLPSDAPMIQVQSFLARRAANKRSAHMTLDDWQITPSDLRDLVSNALLIARAIQRVHGNDVYNGNYQEVDKGAYEAASKVLGHRHAFGLLLVDLDANVDLFRQKSR
jgi:hypothetical protein